mmetsp:Transcript_27337/g.53290  ORF Transcript_27337/g.53290 Transcript_27337/m.53290 type:complete len:118 (-) Transcript_27337:230-583(-)
MYKKALRINRKTIGPTSAAVGKLLVCSALVLGDLGKYEEQAEGLEEALGILRGTLGDEHDEVALALYHLGRCRVRTGDEAQGLQCLRQAQSIYAKGRVCNAASREVSFLVRTLEGSG